jgi:hypothetical protein
MTLVCAAFCQTAPQQLILKVQFQQCLRLQRGYRFGLSLALPQRIIYQDLLDLKHHLEQLSSFITVVAARYLAQIVGPWQGLSHCFHQ